MSETFLAINVTVIQLSLNVLLVMDCVTARCSSQAQPTKMTLSRRGVLSSSVVRASTTRRVVGLNPIWGSDFFCVLLWLILYIPLYFFYND